MLLELFLQRGILGGECEMPVLSVRSHGATDVGLRRGNNEDVYRILEKEHFFALADGMGGHNAGEVAASRAVEYMCSAIKTLSIAPHSLLTIEDLKSHLIALVENTNLWVHHLGASDPDLFGMGTTLSTLIFHQNHMIYSHVGDSRIYRFRASKLEQLTRDQVVSSNPFEEDEKEDLPSQESSLQVQCGRKMLAQAIGTSILVAPEVGDDEVQAGDLYLICSDGLSDCVSNEAIESELIHSSDLQDSIERLISLAKAGGGHDNITLILVQIM